MKLGVQLYSLREMAKEKGPEAIFEAVAEAGYDGVEFAGFYGKTPDEINALLKKYRLVGVSAHIKAQAIDENLGYIDALGIKNVFAPVTGMGNEPFDDEEKYLEYRQIFADAKKLLDARGVSFGYHNHDREFSNGKNFQKRLCGDVKGATAELDVFWAYVAGRDPVAEMKNLKGALSFVHIKEAAKEEARTSAQPIVGEGAIDMPAVFKEAKAQNIEWAILEVENYPCPEAEYLKKSCENMRKMSK